MGVSKSNPQHPQPGSGGAEPDAPRTLVDSTLVSGDVNDSVVRPSNRPDSSDSMVRPASEATLGAGTGEPSRYTGPLETRDGKRLGRFEIERLLGRGGQGQVWLALDPVLGRRVAIKELPRGTELTEARVAASIEHPNVCRVYDFLASSEHDFIVMEFVDGETLLRAIRRGLPLEEGLKLLWQVARGLLAAHERGVVHRDLKSENVLLTLEGVAKITDFGIARRDSDPSPSERVLAGTPHSMSPEQTLGLVTDARSDLFSFGVLCHDVIVGRSPFQGRDLRETLHRVRSLNPPPLHELEPNVPRSLSQLVERLLAKSPTDRLSSAEHVVHALESVVGQTVRTGVGPSSGRGERRQVLLLACELAQQVEREDPEHLLTYRQDYRRAVERAVDELGGSVHVAVGQQYVLCFGFPVPHEDSALRAARAALRIRDWASGLGPVAIGVRLALHAGTAVIFEQGRSSELELGGLLGAVQALRDLSPVGAIATSEIAREMLGAGASFGEPREALLGGRAQTFRPLERLEDTRRLKNALPLVGREEERQLLSRACLRAQEHNGKLVVLQGEPGIGKSRLLRAVRDDLAQKLRWAAVRATPDTTHTPFAPLAELLGDLLGMGGVPDGAERRSRAQGRLRSYGLAPDEVLPYFDSLLRLKSDVDALPPAWESPERRRELTLSKIVTLLQRCAEKEPLVLAIEDVHWADASTLELLERLAQRLGTLPLTVILTARPEFARPGLSGPNVTVLQLGALSQKESAALVSQAFGSLSLPEPLLARIVERSEGVPLFLEHVTRALRGQAADLPPASGEIPFSLRDLFAAQLHRIGPDRGLLEVAAVIGREFELSLLRRSAHQTGEELEQSLPRLAGHGLIELAPASDEDVTWQFRHALIRDAVYDSMLKQRRQALHAEVLEALGAASPRSETERPELLARHAEGAGALERAIGLWRRAARRAADRYALREADESFARCLGLLGKLPDVEERDERELELLAERGAIQQALFGYAADPVVSTYSRADELCQALTEVPFPVIRGVWNVHVMRGEKPATLKYADRIERLLSAERLQRLDRSMAHNCLGTFHWFTGEFRRSLHHYEAAAYDAKDHGAMVAAYGGCGGAYCRILGPYARAVLGAPGAAHEESLEVVASMQQLGDPFSHAMALLYDVMLDRELGALSRADESAAELLARCQQYGFAHLLPLAGITVAAGQVRKHKDLAALKSIGDSLTGLAAVGARTPAAYWLAWLAEALLEVGAAEDALGALEHGFLASGAGLDHLYDAELHRVKARALGALGRPAADVVAELEAALAIAQEREHALFELKAASDLAELVAKSGERPRAHALLRAALAKLEPGGEIPVLERAKALLDACSQG